jgi:hypothetical protein
MREDTKFKPIIDVKGYRAERDVVVGEQRTTAR